MKLMVLSLSLIFSLSAMADVRKDVQSLGRMAMGYKQHRISGKNAKQILAKFFEITSGDSTIIDKEAREMIYGDEIDHGFTSTASAREMKEFALASLEEKREQLKDIGSMEDLKKVEAKIRALTNRWDDIIKGLHSQGVKFGYSGNGPGYCGMSFIELLIIDEKEQKLYEVFLSEASGC